ncbi:hypothetical protein [Archaeoglobus neptunius]|uniref:hypothetical protein n=1 Tax=Archaeoglobus neptunius TaxID=2798580 RepID=UPI0019278C25|nr:hypothetical protein [Archaeoglobus neptunius]
MKEVILKLYDLANIKDWKPWELQTELKKIYEDTIAVGDDLSFTVKLKKDLKPVGLEDFGGKKCKMHPFRTAWRFDSGFIAFEGKFLRISRKIDKNLLSDILELILPED